MRDFNRKLDKFLKVKIATDKKNRALSPHVTYGVIATPTMSTAYTTTKKNSRNFSMTVSFYNPRFDGSYPKDCHIRHEDNKQKYIMASPERAKSPKRDPILQNNEEPARDFKPSLKQTELTGKMTIFTAEPTVTIRNQGEFNHVHNARSISPKLNGKKTFVNVSNRTCVNDELVDESRRVRKGVSTAPKNPYNPILEGEGPRIKRRNEKTHIRLENSEHARKINDRKALLPSELGASPKGKVFWDTKITLDHSVEAGSPVVKPMQQRFSSPQHAREGVKGILEYQHALPYRGHAVTPKCTSFTFSEMASPMKGK